MLRWNLLEKTTFWIEGIDLQGVNLEIVSNAAAEVLGLNKKDIMVVDVRPGLISFDVLKRDISPGSVVGKGKRLINHLKNIQGVEIKNSATIHSDGILGLIAMESEETNKFLTKSFNMANEVSEKVSKRILVFASGTEISNGNVLDTNSTYLIDVFNKEGFSAQYGGILPDDAEYMTECMDDALNEGFGTIVITGGTGAEDKDFTIEAIKKLDPNASISYILRFTPDGFRHYQDGVKIAIGEVGITRIVALPGPHDEVKLISEVLINGVRKGLDKYSFSKMIAIPLRKKWERIMYKEV